MPLINLSPSRFLWFGLERKNFSTCFKLYTNELRSLGSNNCQNITQKRRCYSTQNGINQMPDVEIIKEFVSEPKIFSYASRDVIHYNLGVGASTMDEDGLKYLYEGHPNFTPLPTFGVVPAYAASVGFLSGEVPGLDIDLTRVLHGEQYMELLAPLPPSGDLTSTYRVVDVLDKGSGMVVITETDTEDDQGRPVLKNQCSTFVVGKGGFGGDRVSPYAFPPAKIPDRPPDAMRDYKTSVDQAALYRILGEQTNPLHIDPEFAAKAGYNTPILNGLCTYGIAARQVLKEAGQKGQLGKVLQEAGMTGEVRKVKARFVGPVLPGQTVRTWMWRDGQRVVFSCEVVETGRTCLDGGYVEFDIF